MRAPFASSGRVATALVMRFERQSQGQSAAAALRRHYARVDILNRSPRTVRLQWIVRCPDRPPIPQIGRESDMRLVRHLIVSALILLVGAAPARAQEVVFSVAISMKEVVEELGRGFSTARPGVTLRYNFGSSGELQKQIEA